MLQRPPALKLDASSCSHRGGEETGSPGRDHRFALARQHSPEQADFDCGSATVRGCQVDRRPSPTRGHGSDCRRGQTGRRHPVQRHAHAEHRRQVAPKESYAQALPLATLAHVTEIEQDFAGDAQAPVFDNTWLETARLPQVSANGLAFSFVTLQKIRPQP